MKKPKCAKARFSAGDLLCDVVYVVVEVWCWAFLESDAPKQRLWGRFRDLLCGLNRFAKMHLESSPWKITKFVQLMIFLCAEG